MVVKPAFLRGLINGIHRKHQRFFAAALQIHEHLCPGRGRHPVSGVSAGLSRELVCGLVGALPGEEALGDVSVGAEPGDGRRLRPAERPSFPQIPGWRKGLGVWHRGVQAGALPVKCEHVRVHLPDLSDEHGPLAGCLEAFHVSQNEDQALAPGSPAGSLGVSVPAVTADALLPQVSLNPCL